ncbi:MAG: type II toxin-antitoxin system VapC family toxin [Anaerolineae bacterium]|nr:type II toxin-antitoxin system VapC family toxin [Anaerolineae bacterium]
MRQAYVDTNVILRFLVNDPPDMAAEAAQLFQAVEDGKVKLVVDDTVIAEAVWVLQSYYRHQAADIATTLRDFLLQNGIETEDKATLLQALTLYETRNIDFADALIAARMQKNGIAHVFSFDTHFDQAPGIHRLLPADFSSLESEQ